ncbi:unnamed protein product [Periconia digitata]|uniref:Uncharacterized protein n=1 Tax=Periconia digitata TaxID=1303443 RepID=A0A9W4UBI1_9PLEO|nr:unnamed protein product [Periconia digitata]
MLTQEDLVVSNMAGQTHLHRSSWKADAIRKGHLKISGPIPITEDVPLNEDEEKEFAKKQKLEDPPSPRLDANVPQTPDPVHNHQHELASLQPSPNLPDSHAIPLQEPVHPEGNDQAPPTQEHPQPQPPPHVQSEAPSQPPPVEEQQQQTSPPPQQSQPASNMQGEPDDSHRRSATYPVMYSTPSPYPSAPDGSLKSTPKKKRKSGLRNVFRKMFGRKDREEALDEDDGARITPTKSRGHNHTTSDPGILQSSPPRNSPLRSQRISELSVSEPQPIKPIGQHLPFPMNVNAPQETSPTHQYLTFEGAPPELGRRRATLPTLLAGAETQSLKDRVQHLEVWHERPESEHVANAEIGIALSGPPHADAVNSLQSKRRSRSAGALRDLAKSAASDERRRSAEIRFWRSSFASGSVRSDQMQRPQTAQTVDTVLSTNIKETVESESHAPPIVDLAPVISQPEVPRQSQEDQSRIELPVEAFNFGDLKSGFSDDEESIRPPAVTHSRSHSPSQAKPERRLSIEDRIKHLEEGMRTLEGSVHRMSGRSNRQTIVLENAPKGRRGSRNRSSSGASDRQESHHSSSTRSRSGSRTTRLRTSDSDLQQHAASASPAPVAPLSAVTEDVSSATLQSPQPGAPIDSQPTASQYNALLAHLNSLQLTLTHERQSRKALETQIITLQREVSDLHSLINRLVHWSPNYPTPSPDALVEVGASEERMATPKAKPSIRGRNPRILQSGGGISGPGYGGHLTNSSSRNSSKEDVLASPGEPEIWATPLEGRFALTSGGIGKRSEE